ncbi:Zinc metalloprotease ZmpB [Labeo rohita]|uniref:Zinc metalloprotease ZmpB n=1 Tax=Labeo rohita TaxID=84645 RepID=A0ABQ8KZD4_LABRO|nr:Zinc metalloprotease ZmpB [Labeo rohita]
MEPSSSHPSEESSVKPEKPSPHMEPSSSTFESSSTEPEKPSARIEPSSSHPYEKPSHPMEPSFSHPSGESGAKPEKPSLHMEPSSSDPSEKSSVKPEKPSPHMELSSSHPSEEPSSKPKNTSAAIQPSSSFPPEKPNVKTVKPIKSNSLPFKKPILKCMIPSSTGTVKSSASHNASVKSSLLLPSEKFSSKHKLTDLTEPNASILSKKQSSKSDKSSLKPEKLSSVMSNYKSEQPSSNCSQMGKTWLVQKSSSKPEASKLEVVFRPRPSEKFSPLTGKDDFLPSENSTLYLESSTLLKTSSSVLSGKADLGSPKLSGSLPSDSALLEESSSLLSKVDRILLFKETKSPCSSRLSAKCSSPVHTSVESKTSHSCAGNEN